MSELTGHERPDPHAVQNAAELVAALRQLRAWAGEPSLRQLTALAGQRRLRDGHLVDALPSSTLSDNLGGRRLPRLPRRSFVAAFVAACMRARGCSDEETTAEVQRWRQAMRRLEATAPPDSSVSPEAAPSEPPDAGEAWHPSSEARTSPWSRDQPVVEVAGDVEPQSRGTSGAVRALRRAGAGHGRVYAAAVGLLVLVVAVGVVIATGRDDSKRSGTTPTAAGAASPRPSSAAATPSQPDSASPQRGLPPAGWYLVQPGHTRQLNYCWGEGRERNGNTNRPLVVQRPCAEAVRTKLVPRGGGVYTFEWHSPQQGLGCISVDYGDQGTKSGALLAPRDCDFGGNRFRLEPYAGGYRLRPVHSGLCVGSVYGARDTGVGAEAMQESCSGGADQWFAFTAAD